MKLRQLVILGAVLVIIFGSYGIKSFLVSQKEEPQFRKPPRVKKYVETSTVSYQDVSTSVVAYGRVESSQSVDLISEISGRMYEGNIRLKVGQVFKKGTLLFYVDDDESSLNLKSQKSNFLRDIAAILPDFKIDFTDNFDSWNGYFGAIDIEKDLPPLPKTKSEKEKTFLATRGIYSTYYTIKSAEVRLKKHRYYAPFDGSVSEVTMQSGSFINPGTKIGKVIRSGALEMKISVETKDIPWIQLGSPVDIVSTETQLDLKGEVARISDYVNQNTQSVDVYVQVFPSKYKVYDGQFMQAAIPARAIKNGMIIPRNVIYNGNEVFVLEDTLLKVKRVDIYRLLEEEAIIGNLAEGSELVVEPLVGAHNNMTAFKLNKKEIDFEDKGGTALGNTAASKSLKN